MIRDGIHDQIDTVIGSFSQILLDQTSPVCVFLVASVTVCRQTFLGWPLEPPLGASFWQFGGYGNLEILFTFETRGGGLIITVHEQSLLQLQLRGCGGRFLDVDRWPSDFVTYFCGTWLADSPWKSPISIYSHVILKSLTETRKDNY